MAENKKDEVVFTESTAARDLRERTERDNKPESVTHDPSEVKAPYATETTDTTHYIGVSPEYMTYANDTEAPLAPEGVEADVLDIQLGEFAFAPPVDDAPNNPTAGGGSTAESIYSATSGEGVTSEVVEPKKDEAPKKAPAKSVAKPVTEDSGTNS